jgi:hypothetical protein
VVVQQHGEVGADGSGEHADALEDGLVGGAVASVEIR